MSRVVSIALAILSFWFLALTTTCAAVGIHEEVAAIRAQVDAIKVSRP